MKKEIGSLIIAASLVEGCSASAAPTPFPDNIVNCKRGPMEAYKEYVLNEGEEIRVGGITKEGKEDAVYFRSKGKGEYEYIPQPGYMTRKDDNEGEFELVGKNLSVTISASPNQKETVLNTKVTCIEAPVIPLKTPDMSV